MCKNTSHTTSQKKYPFRKLEDLNLIDNFLFQQMLSQKNDGELFAKILLSTILGKLIKKVRIMPQKNILSTDTDRHGIRLDAYILKTEQRRVNDLTKSATDSTYRE